MRMILFIISFMMVINAVAQQDCSWEVNHYKETKTFVEDGYTYQCDVNYGLVTLYNKENKWTYEDQIDTRTGEIYAADLETAGSIDKSATKKVKEIIDNAFSREEAQRIAEHNIFQIILFFNPITGNVDEVCYEFFIFDDCANIPVSYYRDMEVKIKKEVHTTPAEEDKYLNYVLVSGHYVPTGRLPSINQ